MKKNKSLILFLSVTGSFLITLGSLITYGKYISNSVWEYYLQTKGFYFSSNELWDTEKTNTNLNWNLDPVEFTITNSKHNTQYTEYDIEYELECTILNDASEHTSCYLNNKETNKDTVLLKKTFECINETEDEVDTRQYDPKQCEKEGYTLKYDKTTDINKFEIVTNNINYHIKNVEVLITAKSIKPYEKILLGKFILKKDELLDNKVTHKYIEKTNYSELLISNTFNENKCISIKFDPEEFVILDDITTLNTSTNDNNVINEIQFGLNTKNSKTIKFNRINKEESFSEEDFNLNLVNGCQ